jgi:hypothetical protein
MTDNLKIQEICEKASRTAETIFKKKVDGIVGLSKNEEGWLVEMEVRERKSIPDTQDILGRYEMRLDESGELLSLRRVMLRRRSDMEALEEEV